MTENLYIASVIFPYHYIDFSLKFETFPMLRFISSFSILMANTILIMVVIISAAD